MAQMRNRQLYIAWSGNNNNNNHRNNTQKFWISNVLSLNWRLIAPTMLIKIYQIIRMHRPKIKWKTLLKMWPLLMICVIAHGLQTKNNLIWISLRSKEILIEEKYIFCIGKYVNIFHDYFLVSNRFLKLELFPRPLALLVTLY